MPLLIEHTLDFQDGFDIPLNIEALVPSTLFGLQKSELRFPETKHIRGKLCQSTHFSDFIENLAPQPGFSSHDRPHRTPCRLSTEPSWLLACLLCSRSMIKKTTRKAAASE